MTQPKKIVSTKKYHVLHNEACQLWYTTCFGVDVTRYKMVPLFVLFFIYGIYASITFTTYEACCLVRYKNV